MGRVQKNEKEKKSGYTGGRPKDESKLSQEPRRIRRRLRYAMKSKNANLDTMARDMEMLYHKPVEDWDFVELAMGRPRNKNGNFAGGRPTWCGPVIERAAKTRLMELTRGKLAGHVEAAIIAIGKLIESDEVDDKGKPIVDSRTKLAASQFVIETFLGKAKAIVEVEATDATRAAIASAIVLDDGLPQGHLTVIEGEFEDDDEELIDEEEDDDDELA